MHLRPLHTAVFVLLIFCLSACNDFTSKSNGGSNAEDNKPVAQKNADKVAVAFYNCENLFDINHEQGKQDRDFTPEGKYHYTQKVYEQKLHNIATVLQSMSADGHGELALMGLAEVENDRVLKDLCAQPEISANHYRHICHSGPDPRGINVAFVYNPALFVLIKEDVIPVVFTHGNRSAHSRDILHVYGVLDGDTVHVLVNHWTSRRGGEDESERKRNSAAQIVKDAVDELIRDNPKAHIMIMGDFNDNPTDNSIALTLAAKSKKTDIGALGLYDPFADLYNAGVGTEKFRSQWNLFDQIILSGALLQAAPHHLHYDKASVYNPDFIRDNSKRHSDEPHRSFVGSKWTNGYSDHFPVMVTLVK